MLLCWKKEIEKKQNEFVSYSSMKMMKSRKTYADYSLFVAL